MGMRDQYTLLVWNALSCVGVVLAGYFGVAPVRGAQEIKHTDCHQIHTHRTPHTNIFVRIDDVITFPLLVEPTRYLWFPLTRGNWCRGFDIRTVVHVTNCWTNIPVACGLRCYHSHFHYWNFARLSYSFKLERYFIYFLPRRSSTPTMVHTCTVSVCRRTDRRTDKVQPVRNISLPPSQEKNGIAITTNIIWCLFYWKFNFWKKNNDSWAISSYNNVW